MHNESSNHGGMVIRLKNPRRRARRVPPPLYIGPWIRSLGSTPSQVAREIGMNEGYLSELISGKKSNPSLSIQCEIAKFLKIPHTYFLRPPPAAEILKETSGLDAGTIARLKPIKN